MSSSASVWDCSLQSPWKRAQRAIVQGFVFPISVGSHWLLRTSCEVRQSMKVCRKSSSAGNNQLFHFIQEEEEMVWVPLLWFFSRNVLSFSSCSNSEQSLSQKIRISRRKPILRFFSGLCSMSQSFAPMGLVASMGHWLSLCFLRTVSGSTGKIN